MKKLTICATLGTALLSNVAFSGAITVPNVTVARISCGVASTSCTAILNRTIGPSQCNSVAAAFDASTSSGKNALALLLTVKAAGMKVNLTVDDTQCSGSNPKLLAVTAS